MWLTMTSGANVLTYFDATSDVDYFTYSGYSRSGGCLYINVRQNCQML